MAELKMPLEAWLRDRFDDSLKMAAAETTRAGRDRLLEDAEYFAIAIALADTVRVLAADPRPSPERAAASARRSQEIAERLARCRFGARPH